MKFICYIFLHFLSVTVYGFNLEWLKFCFTALLAGICATVNLRIQAIKQSRYKAGSKQDIHLKDAIFALSWGAQQ